MSGKTCYHQLGASPACQAYLRQSLEHTWFGFANQHFVSTTKGSRPGDSWADIVFNILFSSILRELRAELHAQGVLLEMPVPATRTIWYAGTEHHSPIPIWQATWADDLALMLRFAQPSCAPVELGRASNTLLTALRRHGMTATIGAGKTEALVLLRGKGALPVRRQLFATKHPTIPVFEEDTLVQLPLTSAYKRLGGWVTAACNLMAELKHRISKARSAFWRIAKDVLRNQKLDLPNRIQIFRSVVLATLCWGAGSWPMLAQQEFHCFEMAVWDLYRLMMPKGKPNGQSEVHSHLDMLMYLHLPEPADLLKEARARHLLNLVRHAPIDLWALLHGDPAALQAY